MAKVPKKIKDYVKRAVNADEETKNVAVVTAIGVGTAATSFAGSLINLQPMAQGTNINERVGNVIDIKKIKIRCEVGMIVGSTATQFRTIVFRSMNQPNNTVPTVSNVLAGIGASTATVSPYNTATESNRNYAILYDKVHTMDIYGNGIDKHFEITLQKKVNKTKVHYSGAAATDYGKGALFMLIISDQALADAPGFNYGIQVWYGDA